MSCRLSKITTFLFLRHLLFVTAQTQEQNDSLRKVGCQVGSLYQNANASATFSIPGVDIERVPEPGQKDKVTLTKSKLNNWTFNNVLGQSSDVYAIDHHLILEQAMYLDPSSTLKNQSSAADAGLSGCAFFFTLPLSDVGKKDDGSCTTVLDEKCVKDFTSQADSASLKVSNNDFDSSLASNDTCVHIADALRDLPASCQKYKEKGSNSLGIGLNSYSGIKPHFGVLQA